MRHNKNVTHLGKTTSHKKAMMRNMAAQVFEHKEIRTTDAKAKELRRVVDRLITYGKKGSLHHRRLAFRFLRDKLAVTRLFDEIAPSYEERNGGYTRIIKLGFRKGDSAPISLIQLVGFEAAADKKKKKADKKESAPKKEAAPKSDEKTKEVKEEVAESADSAPVDAGTEKQDDPSVEAKADEKIEEEKKEEEKKKEK